MTMPPISFGNMAQDISSAGANFAMGMKKERENRRALALQDALLAVKQQEADAAMRRATQGPNPIRHTAVVGGKVRNVLTDPMSAQSRLVEGVGQDAPSSQYFTVGQDQYGNLVQLQGERYAPGAPMTVSTLPEGVAPRSEAPILKEGETPSGPVIGAVDRRKGTVEIIGGPGGEPFRPAATGQELEKAQYALAMDRAARGMDEIASKPVPPGRASPVEEAVNRMNVQGVLASLPAVGAPLGEVAQRAMGLGMSEEAALWLANFYQFVGYAVPALAGRQMTIQEMRMVIAMYVPLIGEPPASAQLKRERMRATIEDTQRAAGSGTTRVGTAQSLNPPPPAAPPTRPNKYFGNNRVQFTGTSQP